MNALYVGISAMISSVVIIGGGIKWVLKNCIPKCGK